MLGLYVVFIGDNILHKIILHLISFLDQSARDLYLRANNKIYKFIISVVGFYADKIARLLYVLVFQDNKKALKGIRKREFDIIVLLFCHAPLSLMKRNVNTFKFASQSGLISLTDCAGLIDRMMMLHGKKQIYGTQVFRKNTSESWKLWPISNSFNVDRRRKRMGFQQTIAEYASDRGIDV